MHNLPGGSLTALATPFRDGRIDDTALAAMVERQINRGTQGLVAGGSTGEAAMLSLSEHARLVRLVAVVAAHRVPVIAGCTASATEAACGLAVAAARAGADLLLLAAPPYVKPTQAGIIKHVRAVARAADLPIVLYDVPGRVGVALADATVAELHAQGVAVGLKDATGDLTRPARLRSLCGPGLRQLTGEDGLAAAYRAMGGDGCISVTANVAPFLCSEMHQCWDSGDLARFSELRDLLAPLHATLFLESNPIPLKAALSALGLCGETLRAPLTPATNATRLTLRDVMRELIPLEKPTLPRAVPRLSLVG